MIAVNPDEPTPEEHAKKVIEIFIWLDSQGLFCEGSHKVQIYDLEGNNLLNLNSRLQVNGLIGWNVSYNGKGRIEGIRREKKSTRDFKTTKTKEQVGTDCKTKI